MKRPLMIKLLSVLICACFLLPACGREPVEPEREQELSIWYVQGDMLSEELSALTEQFNAETGSVKVLLRAFATEEEFAAAMDSARPDMILCGHERAFALHEQGRLRDISAGFSGSAPAFHESFLQSSPCVGRSFFPAGAETPLLAVNSSAFKASSVYSEGQEPFSSLEKLCAAAAAYGQNEGKVFFTADSFASLFAAALAESETPFTGIRQEDIKSTAYKEVYNMLAEAAYCGGVAGFGSPALPLAESGDTVCALVSSPDIAPPLAEELSLYPQPLFGDAPILARSYGLAVTSPFADRDGAAARFISWLYSPERVSEAAQARGLIPSVSCGKPQSSDPRTELLHALSSSPLYFPELDNGCFRMNLEFEESFRAALEMLK